MDTAFFKKPDSAAQSVFIKKIMSDTNTDVSVHYFLQNTKSFTIKGYLQSEYVMTNNIPYKMTPEPFKGCIKV